MNNPQQLLVSLLSSAIRGEKPNPIPAQAPDWVAAFEHAKEHDIYALLYPAVSCLGGPDRPEGKLLTEWQRAAMVAGQGMIQHLEEIGEVIRELHSAEISAILLKGLVLGRHYPAPELRTMVDADIFVLPGDVERIKQILFSRGYAIHDQDEKHIQFDHEIHLSVEIHTALLYHTNFKHSRDFQEQVWKSAIPSDAFDGKALELPPEDQLLYLCFHMADHIQNYGFGLRQLCDLVLLVEKEYGRIDWGHFKERASAAGLLPFTQAIFHISGRLLGLQIPLPLLNGKLDRDPFVEKLIADIFTSGIHGHGSKARHLGNSFLRYSDTEAPALRAFLFPPKNKLREKYGYARRFPILIPLAWLHRLVFNLKRCDLSILKAALFSSKEARSVFKTRSELLRWLGLR